MIIQELTVEHLRSIKVRDFELSDLGDNFIQEQEEDFLASDYKKAIISEKGEVVFILGSDISNRFGAWSWLIGSDLMKKTPITSMKIIASSIKEREIAYRAKGLKYFYTFHNPGFPFALKFLERLGYVQRNKVMFEDGVERVLLVKEF